jgi:indolepyruvate ferredoxin oxidoreductase, beta subunit
MIAGSPKSWVESPPPRAITIAILAMGGEGGGVLADWLVDVAEHGGYVAQTTSVPGVAQRTGSTIYYLEMFPEAAARAAGKEPVLALLPVPGELDIVIASELMEAGRAVQRGFVTQDRTTLIASTHRVYSMTERTAIGDGRADGDAFLAAGMASARTFVRADFARIAQDTGSVISAPLFGAIAAAGVLPFTRLQYEEAIRRGGVGVDASLAAFATGFAAAAAPAAPVTSPAAAPTSFTAGPRVAALLARVFNSFPAASHAVLQTAVVRLADYQDEAYAAEYLARLEPVRDLDATYGRGDFQLLSETARQLALWMSYEDAVRVADLKIRRTRFGRVHEESRAGSAQILQINEFLHPRVQEIADILPAPLGRWLLGSGWVRGLVERLTRHGRIVRTTSLTGFLQLYFLAALRPSRRRSLRFQFEQRAIDEWLAQVRAVIREDYALALEVAECPGLLKGYGDTHLRGSKNFEAVMGALPAARRTGDPAGHLRALRHAALADDTGAALAAALAGSGPPPPAPPAPLAAGHVPASVTK